jgi:hypothetical protein
VEFSADPQNDKLEFPTPDHDHIYVYVEADFVGVSNRVQQLMTLASFFRIIVAPNHPAYRPALDALLKTPPIQKFVSRRQRGRKTAQEEQSQSPE